jgi:hypothetical protein
MANGNDPTTNNGLGIGGAIAAGAAAENAGKPTDWLWGLDFLGRGYNIFNRVADAGSLKAAFLLDLKLDEAHKDTAEEILLVDESLPITSDNAAHAFVAMPPELTRSYLIPKNIMCDRLFTISVVSESSTSLRDQINNWGVGVEIEVSDETGLFGGEAKVRYTEKSASISSYQHFSSSGVRVLYNLELSDIDELPVSESAKKLLDDENLAPEKLFDKVGTHYLHKLTMGSDFILGVEVDGSELSSQYDVEASLKAHFTGEDVKGGASVDANLENRIKEVLQHATTTVEGRGISEEQTTDVKRALLGGSGDEAGGAAAGGAAAGAQPPIAKPGSSPFDAALSVMKGSWRSPTLIGFPKDGALQPIWNLCTKKSRSKQLEEAFPAYASQHGYPMVTLGYLRTLYLFTHDESDGGFFRFSTMAAQVDNKDDQSVQWRLYRDEPWGYIFSKQMPGTTGLYAFRALKNDLLMRYETEAWLKPLEHYGLWTRASDNPIGWVFDVSVPDTNRVYAFFPKGQGVRPRYVYRTDSVDWGGWDVTDEQTAVARMVPAPTEPGFLDKLGELVGAESEPARGYNKILENLPAPSGGWFAPTLAWKPAKEAEG